MTLNRFFSGLAALALTFVFVIAPRPASAEEMSREEIESIVRDYILSNPEVMVEALQNWQEKQQAEAEARQQQALTLLPTAFEGRPLVHIAGNPEGDVTVYEFFDYNCGYCKQALPDVLRLIDEDKGVRVVMIEFPILKESSYIAGQAAIAAEMQGKYMEFHTAVMKAKGQLSEGRLLEIATSVGIDPARLAKDMRSKEVATELDQNYQIAKILGVNSTPNFIIGTQVAPGAVSYKELKAMVAAARE